MHTSISRDRLRWLKITCDRVSAIFTCWWQTCDFLLALSADVFHTSTSKTSLTWTVCTHTKRHTPTKTVWSEAGVEGCCAKLLQTSFLMCIICTDMHLHTNLTLIFFYMYNPNDQTIWLWQIPFDKCTNEQIFCANTIYKKGFFHSTTAALPCALCERCYVKHLQCTLHTYW